MGPNAVPIGQDRLLCLTGYGGRLLLPASDRSLMREIVSAGGMEFPLTRYFLKHVRPGHRVLDIGANFGYFSVLLGKLIGPEGKLWAYEPHPELLRFLTDNLSINYLRDWTEIVADAKALDDRADEFGRIDFAKIDIGCGQFQALTGMEQLIGKQIRHLVFEVKRSRLAEDWEPFCGLLRRYRRDCGKRFSLLSADGLPVPISLEDLLAKSIYPYVLMHD